MDRRVQELKEAVINGEMINRDDAEYLSKADLEEVCKAADEIRQHYMGNDFDMCAVFNMRGGRCSEDCAFCPQSCRASSEINVYETRDPEVVVKDAKKRSDKGIRHYCMVSSGRKMGKQDLKKVCEAVRRITEETDLTVCVSLGLLDDEDLEMLKEAGVKRIHNNLETSRTHFSEICSTHTYDEKIAVLKKAHAHGMEICSGGIIGIADTIEDRIDLAFQERELEPESVPVNMLNPYKGTPMEGQKRVTEEEIRRTMAIFRFILPKSFLRLAAGRLMLEDTGLRCFQSGSNATITGDMLNVKGITMEKDLQAISGMGYELDKLAR